MQTPTIAQLFALGLAASTAVNGHQVAGNANVVRRVAVSRLLCDKLGERKQQLTEILLRRVMP